jgi:small-conductance mechanosensitive channel
MNAPSLGEQLQEILTRKHLFDASIALFILLAGTALARRARATIASLERLDPQMRLLSSKLGYYGLLSAALAAALSQIGVDIKVIVGAAGVMTVAVGFAAQTSASNLISGLFLMIERPFVVGDVIAVGAVGGTTGEVLSIDLLSSKIRTFTNLMIRIPNETLVKSQIINYSYFPVRRVDLSVNVIYKSDLHAVERVLREVAQKHPLSLEDPPPVFLCNGFNDHGIALQFQVWTLSDNMVTLQNELHRDIKVAFDTAGIAIAFPKA